MAVSGVVPGGCLNSQMTRSVERLLEDAQFTGELNLSGRNLKELPKITAKYDLDDVVAVDLSKNRFAELPEEVCNYLSLEVLNCYHNTIRCIPEAVVQLQCLTHLNLSRNQLTTVPPAVFQLSTLNMLIVCNNKLVSLPEEISQLQNLIEIDASCNEISHLPPQIGYINSLRSLKLRRNLLVEVPIEVTMLQLTILDISENRIVFLPSRLRFMDSLIELCVENNPLSLPPAYLCTRGRFHIFKFLEIQAVKEEQRKNSYNLDSEYRRSQKRPIRCSFDSRLNGFTTVDDRHRRQTLDSGYNTSDGDKRSSHEFQELIGDADDPRKLPPRMSEVSYAKRMQGLNVDVGHFLVPSPNALDTLPPSGKPTTPGELRVTTALLDGWKHGQENNKEAVVVVVDGHQRSLVKPVGVVQHDETRRKLDVSKAVCGLPADSGYSVNETYSAVDGCCISSPTSEHPATGVESNPYGHAQTYREYKESLRIQRKHDNHVYRRPQPELTNGFAEHEVDRVPCSPSSNNLVDDRIIAPQPELLQSPFEAKRLHMYSEEEKRKQKLIQKEAVLSFVKSRTSPLKSASSESDHCSVSDDGGGGGSKSSTPAQSPCPPPSSPNPTTMSVEQPLYNHVPTLTPPLNSHRNGLHQRKLFPHVAGEHLLVKKMSDKSADDLEQIESLRRVIECRLKVTLPEDLGSALTDGVVLCHLANNVRPRSVASIHVPSPAVPKLTMAKCRRNVENFLEACARIGVPKDCFCSPQDILEERNLSQVAMTVNTLLKFHNQGSETRR